jgi:cytochrome c
MQRLRAAVLIAGAGLLTGCGLEASAPSDSQAAQLTGGDPHAGRQMVREYGCAACHTIPGVPGADGAVGPALSGLYARLYIAGVLPNTPENLVRWIQDPPAVDSLTAMPKLNVREPDARDIAAFLYTVPG